MFSRNNHHNNNDTDRRDHDDEDNDEHVPLTTAFRQSSFYSLSSPEHQQQQQQQPSSSTSSISLFHMNNVINNNNDDDDDDNDRIMMMSDGSSSSSSDSDNDNDSHNKGEIMMQKLKKMSRMIKQSSHHLIHLKNTATSSSSIAPPPPSAYNNHHVVEYDMETAATEPQPQPLYNNNNNNNNNSSSGNRLMMQLSNQPPPIPIPPSQQSHILISNIELNRIGIHDSLVVCQLMDIPDHMLIHMCYYLSYRSLLQLRCVNQQMNRVSSHYELWVREAFRINLLRAHHRFFRAIYTFQYIEHRNHHLLQQQQQKKKQRRYYELSLIYDDDDDDNHVDNVDNVDDEQRIVMDHSPHTDHDDDDNQDAIYQACIDHLYSHNEMKYYCEKKKNSNNNNNNNNNNNDSSSSSSSNSGADGDDDEETLGLNNDEDDELIHEIMNSTSNVRELMVRLNHQSASTPSPTFDGSVVDRSAWSNDVGPTILRSLRALEFMANSEELRDRTDTQHNDAARLYLECICSLHGLPSYSSFHNKNINNNNANNNNNNNNNNDNDDNNGDARRDEGNRVTREEVLDVVHKLKRRRREELEDGFNWDVLSLEHKLQLMHKIERQPSTFYYGPENNDDDNDCSDDDDEDDEDNNKNKNNTEKKVQNPAAEKQRELRRERRQKRRARLVQIMDKGKEMLNETDYRQLFIGELCKRGVVNVERTKCQSKYKKSIRLQVLYQALYGALCPLLFLIGLLTQIFIYPLYVDGKIAHTTLNHVLTFLPFAVLSIPSYLVILSGLLTDPYLLNRYKQKWYDRTERLKLEIPANRRNYIDGSTDHLSIDAINLLSWSLGCLPLCICMIYVKLLVNRSSFLFSYALIPNYALMVALLIVPPIVIRHVRDKQPLTHLLDFPPMDGDQTWKGSSRFFITLVWFLCVLMNAIFCLQAGLLAAKADGLAFSKTKYSLLFLPMWFTVAALVCFCPITCCVASGVSNSNEEENDAITFSTALVGCCGPCVILPLQIASILVALLLDKALTGYMSAVFVPVMISGLMLTCCICLACSACFCFKCVQYVDFD